MTTERAHARLCPEAHRSEQHEAGAALPDINAESNHAVRWFASVKRMYMNQCREFYSMPPCHVEPRTIPNE